jgi:hypothetical protein
MPAELELVVFAIAAPAAVALTLAAILQRVLPEKIGQRIALAVALAAGFCAGYWLLGEWTSLMPRRHRQWLPWLAMAAALVGRGPAPIWSVWSVLAFGSARIRRWRHVYVHLPWALLTIASAWLLVPSWPTLWPSRQVTIPLLAAYLFLLMTLLAALPDRLLGRTFVALLAAAGVATALLIAIGVSFRIGAIAVAAAAAVGGCAVVARANYARGMIPIFSVLIGGLAFVGTIEPQKPLPIILLAPAAPLGLWLFAAGSLAKFQGWKAVALQSAAVALPLVFALVWLVISP